MPFVYILQCSDNTLYTGSTTDLDRRFLQHNAGKGARYTRGRLPVQVVYSEETQTMSEALSREAEIKKWPRCKKEALIGI